MQIKLFCFQVWTTNSKAGNRVKVIWSTFLFEQILQCMVLSEESFFCIQSFLLKCFFFSSSKQLAFELEQTFCSNHCHQIDTKIKEYWGQNSFAANSALHRVSFSPHPPFQCTLVFFWIPNADWHQSGLVESSH